MRNAGFPMATIAIFCFISAFYGLSAEKITTAGSSTIRPIVDMQQKPSKNHIPTFQLSSVVAAVVIE